MSAAASLRMRRFGQSRNSGDKALSVVVGFAIVGLILAGVAAAFIYFGSRFIDGLKFAEKNPPAETQAAAAPLASAPPPESAETPAEAPASALEGLSAADLEKLRQLLRADGGQSASSAAAAASAPEIARGSPVEHPELRAANQGIVDRLQLQGFRKAGQSSRALLNGKLYQIGDVVDQASGLFIAGYTDSTLVFEDPLGYRYERAL